MRGRTNILAIGLLVAGCQGESSPPIVVRTSTGDRPVLGERITYPSGHQATLHLPDGQTQVINSMLNIRHTMKFGDYVWNERGVPGGTISVRVDLLRQTISVFRSGHEIGSAVILFGATDKPSPAGIFPVLQKKIEHRSTLYVAEMPYMLRLTGDGIAVHASQVREGTATHGCIGVPLPFARLLYEQIGIGDKVAIVGT